MLDVLTNPSVRRFVVFLLTFLTALLHRKVGLDLDPNDLLAVITVGLGYIGQSAVREAVVAHADAKTDIAQALAGKSAVPPSPAQ